LTDDPNPLRICVLGDLYSVHTRRWMRPFVERGHELHAISYYRPAATFDGVHLHVLDGRPRPSEAPASRAASSKAPPNLLRIANALRYRRRGLARVLRDVDPDVLHAHYVVEYGFFAATAGFHPLIVTAWGSDILLAARASPLARFITRYTLRRADLVTSNNDFMTAKLRDMGVPPDRLATVVFGADAFFLERHDDSVNVHPPDAGRPPTIVSTRSLDAPLYNVDLILRAFALLRARIPDARLLIAGEGRLRPRLESLARDLGLDDNARFLGWLDDDALRDAFAAAEVYVSVPSSDATSVSTLSAMAAGCFPVLSDLPTQHEWVEHGVNGYLAPLASPQALAQRLGDALDNAALRRDAATRNRRIVEERGIWQKNALVVEDCYRSLAGSPLPWEREGNAPLLPR
jgi:glycosyltransferase involved in cell wall biosynthesis